MIDIRQCARRAGVIAMLAAPVFAQEPLQEGGRIDMTIGETPHVFVLDAGESGWSGSENFAAISLHAQPADDAQDPRFRSLVLSFEYMGGPVNNPEVRLTRVNGDGSSEDLLGKGDVSSIVVTIDTIAADRDMLTLSGNVSGALGTSDDAGLTVDMDTPLTISGRFDVVLGAEL